MTQVLSDTKIETGGIVLSGPAARLYHAWDAFLRRRLAPFVDSVHHTPAFIDPDVLEAARYDEHFPGNVLRAGNGTASLCLTPAACFHAYPIFKDQAPGEHTMLVSGPCARYEYGKWKPPFRLSCFHMTEIVAMGSRERIGVLRQDIRDAVGSWFDEVGLRGRFEAATDAFFLSADRGARLLQQLKGLKQEFRVGGVAVASVNDHEEYFGRAFDIRDSEGETACSFCAAFGLERLVAAGLELWGHSPENWPRALRS